MAVGRRRGATGRIAAVGPADEAPRHRLPHLFVAAAPGRELRGNGAAGSRSGRGSHRVPQPARNRRGVRRMARDVPRSRRRRVAARHDPHRAGFTLRRLFRTCGRPDRRRADTRDAARHPATQIRHARRREDRRHRILRGRAARRRAHLRRLRRVAAYTPAHGHRRVDALTGPYSRRPAQDAPYRSAHGILSSFLLAVRPRNGMQKNPSEEKETDFIW